jgi:PAS domain S-box-containing protein
MNLSSPLGTGGAGSFAVLWEDGERVLCRGWRDDGDGNRTAVLAVLSASEHPTPGLVDRLAHEYGLKDELDGPSVVRPLEFLRERGQTRLLLEDPGGEPLAGLLGQPMEMGRFLRIATGLSAALRRLHERGLIHKDIKPANVLVDSATGYAWLTGFGIASRLPRERQSREPPELLAGTLAYMAPEQTGRMNRSIDSRSDLYSLGVTLYEMLTGSLPFTASDPMEWVHCHIAKQPAPPVDRVTDVPVVVSAIILKLLTKTAEERYQTAAGVEGDLRRCLAQWERQRRIEAFPLCEQDTSDRLLVPEKLYGRVREIDTLLAAFDRVVAGGATQLLLVSGYSGIGKSSVVNELHKALVPTRGLFAAGKFDQYKRDVPYGTLAQAFQSLIHPLLGKSEAELGSWRDSLRQALRPNGRLIVDLIPELKLIIGEQPPVPDLPPQDAQNRFQLVFRRFLGAFARPEHPLALFLDDLQWLDAATLDLLEHLVTHPDVRHLLLVGAYRDNEVSPSHPLVRMLEAIRKAGARVHEIVLAPLELDDVGQLVADALHCTPEHVRPLAQLVQEKTGGNPFFAIQFFTALAEGGLLAFDPVTRAWQWSMDRIRAKNYTDNVVDLMAAKLKRLSSTTQEALKQLACLGNVAPTAILALVHETTAETIHAALSEAVHAGLVFREDVAYKFLHDRIQQAAYTLIPEEHRADAHLRIGRVLLANMTGDQLAEHLFDIANHFNRGATRLVAQDEKTQVAAIELRAGRKAKASAAYASACVHLAAGMALIGRDGLDNPDQYELAFALCLERAECELLSGNFDEADRLIPQLVGKGTSKVDKAAAYSLKIHLHLIKSEKPQGVDAALECLRLFDIKMPAHPTRGEVQAEYESVWRNLKEQSIESLIDLPLMTDPDMHAAMRVLAFLTGPALYTDINLYHLHFCKMVNLSLRYGVSDASTFGYAGFGVMLCEPFQRYADGYRFGKLACDLVEKHGFAAYKAKVYLCMEMVALWTQPIETGIEFVRTAFRAGAESSDLPFACFSCLHLVTDLLAQGIHLDDVWRESETCLDFVRKGKYLDAADALLCQRQLIRNLRGQTATFSTFSDGTFDEENFEAQLTEDRMTALISRYWILKVQARFMSGDYRTGLVAAERAKKVHWSSEAFFHSLDYYYYTALTVAALYEKASGDEQREWRELLTLHREQLRAWADSYPPTFADKHALVAAEIARIEGRDADAMRLYKQAIRSAHEQGFVQNEGLAYEVAARFYAARGLKTIADAYLRNARSCYFRWGADGKVRQLDRLYPHLAAEGQRPTAALGTPIQQLDVASIVKASQAVSSEIELPKLIERLMTLALENAGADRGLLILPIKDDYFIQAEAQAAGGKVEVALCKKEITSITCPDSLLRYVIRTLENVLLDDASRPNLFSEDDYLRGRKSTSILCLPLIKQGQLTGLLYLENTLTSHAFTPDRIAVLELLAAQAAISLENTRLYSDLQEREAKVRRLVDSNIIGIFIWDLDGRIIEANEAFLHMVGHSRDDLSSGRMRWTELTPKEWSDATERSLEELRATGNSKALEKEYFRKDGSRVPVLLGAASFSESRDEGVAFVLDLTERKRAEAALRERAQLLDLTHDTIFVRSMNDAISFWNRGAEQLYGWTREEALGRIAQQLLRTSFPAPLEEIMSEVLGTGRWEGELVHTKRDATQVSVVSRWSLQEDERGRPVGILETNNDITERKRAEYLTGQVFERSPDSMCIVGKDYRLQRVNPVFEQSWGKPAAALVGMHVAEVIGTELFERHSKPSLDRCFAGEEVSIADWYVTARGPRYRVVTHSPLRTDQQLVEAALLIGRDFTDYVQASEALRTAQMELAHVNRVTTMGQLTASIAHEVNQPLAGIMTSGHAALNWLAKDAPDLEAVRQSIERVIRDASRAGSVIGRIRDVIKKAPRRNDRFNINEAIGEVIELTRGEAVKDGVSLRTQLATGLPLIEGDRVELQQVILNLIINAIQAMSGTSQAMRDLLITTSRAEPDSVLVAVKDSGPGLAPESADNIFEPFYTTKPGGLGMGLSICRSIIEAHGGRLWLTENAPSGAIFQFTVPGRRSDS